MNDVIFREYDIRGIVGGELDIEQVYPLGHAFASYLTTHHAPIRTVAVGMDGRLHSPAIKKRLCAALCDAGLDVLFLGICPTPVCYFAQHISPDVDASIMITASHNPKEYNGFKLTVGKEAVWGSAVQAIKEQYHKRVQVNSPRRGTYREYEIIDTYVTWMRDHFTHLHGNQMRIVIDCANSVAGAVMPQLISAFEWPNVRLLYPEVDGTFPNHEADPVVEENMRDLRVALRRAGGVVGMGFDGDCDRMAAMTARGKLVPGDQLLALFARDMLSLHPQAGVVCDVKVSDRLLALLREWGAHVYLSPTGHAHIKQRIKQHKALLGGELSCHFCFADRYFGFDDGIYALLRLIELLDRAGKPLHELVDELPRTQASPELRLACGAAEVKKALQAAQAYFADKSGIKVTTIDGVRVSWPYGWGLVRASNTQPVISLRFEADSAVQLRAIRQDFHLALAPYLGAASLRRILQE